MKKLIMYSFIAMLAAIGTILLAGCSSPSPDAAPTILVLDGEVSAVEIRLTSARLVLKTVETGTLSVTADGIQADTLFSEGLLSVTETRKTAKEATVTVCLGENVLLSAFSAETGAGNVSLQRLSCREATIDCKVGDIEIEFASIPEKLHLKTGTGDVSVQFPGTDQINIQAPYGLGARDYADRFTVTEKADIVIDVSAGNTTLR